MDLAVHCFVTITLVTTVSPQVWEPSTLRRPSHEPFTTVTPPKTAWKFECEVKTPTENLTWPPADGTRAAFFQASRPSAMLPIKINYVLAEATSRGFQFMLQWAFRRANAFFAKRIKSEAQPQDSMGYVRDWTCSLPAKCHINGAFVPFEYTQQCSRWSEPGILQNPSEEINLLASNQVATTIYVRTWNSKRPTPGCTSKPGTDLWAFTSRCVLNNKDSRPLHSVIVFCKQLNEFEDDHLLAVLLHETIHALSSGSFVGERTTKYLPYNGPIYEGAWDARKNALHGRTWRQIQHVWPLKSGATKRATVEVVMTPTVMDVVKDYFRCYNGQLQGAELSRKLLADGSIKSDVAHWSMRLFPEDIIAPMVNGPDVKLSKLTLAMLKDTGWYDVNMSAAQPLDYDASRVLTGGEYCHLARQGCDEVLKNAKQQLFRSSYTVLPWVGPYCDPNAETATRACSPDGRFRLQCYSGGNLYALGCSVYVKNSTLDAYGMDCPDMKRSREDAMALVGHPYRSMCISFRDYSYSWSSSTWTNHPACYEFNCTPETRSFDIHVIIPGQDPCKLSQFCGDGKPAVKSWSGCWPPRSGTVICPVYEDVCVKPGGIGNPNTTIHWPSDQARQMPNETRRGSASNGARLSTVWCKAFGMIISVLLILWN